MTLPSEEERSSWLREQLEAIEGDEDYIADQMENTALRASGRRTQSSFVEDFVKILESQVLKENEDRLADAMEQLVVESSKPPLKVTGVDVHSTSRRLNINWRTESGFVRLEAN